MTCLTTSAGLANMCSMLSMPHTMPLTHCGCFKVCGGAGDASLIMQLVCICNAFQNDKN